MRKFIEIKNAVQNGKDGGIWQYKSPIDSAILYVIASNGMGWDHVSVSRKNRCPNWTEMCFIKDIFFEENEVVIQYHPAKKDYINNFGYCLHLWKPQDVELPKPPSILVGIKELNVEVDKHGTV